MFNISFKNETHEFAATIAKVNGDCYGIGYGTFDEIKHQRKPSMLFALTFEDAKEKLRGICKEYGVPELSLVLN